MFIDFFFFREREKHPCEREAWIYCPPICNWPHDWSCNLGLCPDWESNWNFFFSDFIYLLLDIYFEREGRGGRKRGRETAMCKRYMDLLPLTHPQLGTWPSTQECTPTRNPTSDLLVRGQFTEPHQPGQPFDVQDSTPTNWATQIRV